MMGAPVGIGKLPGWHFCMCVELTVSIDVELRLRQLLKRGIERGYVTLHEVWTALEDADLDWHQMREVADQIHEVGIAVLEEPPDSKAWFVRIQEGGELTDAELAVSKLLEVGQTHGYVTLGDVVLHLNEDMFAATDIEEIVALLHGLGVEVRADERASPSLEEGAIQAEDALLPVELSKLIERGKDRGYVTYEEIHHFVPQFLTSEPLTQTFIDAVSSIGIDVHYTKPSARLLEALARLERSLSTGPRSATAPEPNFELLGGTNMPQPTKPSSSSVQPFGRRVKTARERANLTLRETAKRLTELGHGRVSHQAVQNWEAGRTGAPLWRIPHIAKVLACSQGYLMGTEDSLGEPVLGSTAMRRVHRTLMLLEQALDEQRVSLTPKRKADLLCLLLHQDSDEGYIRELVRIAG